MTSAKWHKKAPDVGGVAAYGKVLRAPVKKRAYIAKNVKIFYYRVAMNDDEDKKTSNMLQSIPCFLGTPIPADFHELHFLPKLIDKIPLYIQKIKELEKVIKESNEIEPLADLIFRSFFLDLENRPYQFLHNYGEDGEKFDIMFEKRRVKWGEIISNRNLSCEICGENRSVDKCHIIPKKFGGTIDCDNIIFLCPTHHRLLDRFMLSKEEYAAINWIAKSPAARHYAYSIILENHKKFWSRVSKGNYSPIVMYENIEWPIYKYALDCLMEIFFQKKVINEKNIFMVLDKNIHEIVHGILSIMLKKGILQRDNKKNFLIFVDEKFQSTDEFAKRCWQALN